MSLSEYTKLSVAFKKLIARDHSTYIKEWYEEEPGGGITSHANEIWTDTIPATAPGSTTSVIKVYVDTGGDGAIKMTEDVSVSGQRGWFAEDPVGTRIGTFVPAKFGQSYTTRVFEDNGSGTGKGNQIFTTDDSSWFFDEPSGYLAFQDATTSFQKPFWIETWRYIGEFVSDNLGGKDPRDFTLGEHDCDVSLNVADAVKMNSTNDKVVIASASGVNIGEAIGICIEKPTSTTCTVRFVGECEVFSGLVAGTNYYLGVDGAITATPVTGDSTVHQFLGVAKNASTLLFERGEPVYS